MPEPRRYLEVKKLVESHGWTLDRVHGSHHVFATSGARNIVIVVHHGKVKPAYVRQAQKIIESSGPSI